MPFKKAPPLSSNVILFRSATHPAVNKKNILIQQISNILGLPSDVIIQKRNSNG